MSSFVTLHKNGQCFGVFGPYRDRSQAIEEAQEIADLAGPGVSVYVEGERHQNPRQGSIFGGGRSYQGSLFSPSQAPAADPSRPTEKGIPEEARYWLALLDRDGTKGIAEPYPSGLLWLVDNRYAAQRRCTPAQQTVFNRDACEFYLTSRGTDLARRIQAERAAEMAARQGSLFG